MAQRGSEQFRSALDDLLRVIARELARRHFDTAAMQSLASPADSVGAAVGGGGGGGDAGIEGPANTEKLT